ncbi:hypothetical protein V1517DRAFT_328025 [Lipomyces orientalis]|uniref:Uncharacterized protein n=1 Tax=Lipomyces orientalis TaxID=1233043 RepID=A0ACC3TIE1_9ASCO
MEVNNRPRKACDLCYTRKLKCDRQTPRCSNCVAYDTDCTHTAQSRKWKPKAQRNGRTKETDEIQGLLTQLRQLKAQLRRVQARVQDQAQNVRQPTTAARFQDRSLDDSDNVISPMRLPPLQESLTMVGIFLNNFNSVLPLFDTDALLHLVGGCYALPPQQRDPVAWAAINVVLALASQQMLADDSDSGGRPRTDRTTEYFNKAQSIISQLMLGEISLLNIQTLVGMVMVLQTARDVTRH